MISKRQLHMHSIFRKLRIYLRSNLSRTFFQPFARFLKFRHQNPGRDYTFYLSEKNVSLAIIILPNTFYFICQCNQESRKPFRSKMIRLDEIRHHVKLILHPVSRLKSIPFDILILIHFPFRTRKGS